MKPYTQHDPILDKGKAEPKPYNPGSSGRGLMCRIISMPRHPVTGKFQPICFHKGPRVRMSKKRRIVLRDLGRVQQNGFSNFVDGFTSIRRRTRVATESFLRAQPGYGLRVQAGIIDPNR